jgi:hypothetical protein
MVGNLILPLLKGPYLLTRVVDHLYHIILLPGDLLPDTLLKVARDQVAAVRLDTCLVAPGHECILIDSGGRVCIT